MSNRRFSGLRIQPSREAMPAGNSKVIAMTVVIGLVIVAALMAASHYVLERYSPNTGYRLVRAKWELLLSQNSPVDVLVLGDSSANQGIDTEYLTATTNLTALNLSTVGTAIAVNDYWMLEEYLDRIGSPTCVVVGHTYDLWYRPINYSLVAQIPIDTRSIRNRLIELSSNNTAQLKFLLAKYFRAYSENISMKELLMYPWTAQETSPIVLADSGFYATHDARPDDVYNDASGHLERVRTSMFVPSNENRYALMRMVRLAEKYRFRLYLANGPLYEGIYEDRFFKRYLADVNTFISDAANQSGYVTHLFSTPVTYKDDEMQLIDHLVAKAAEHYTQKLIENMNCALHSIN